MFGKVEFTLNLRVHFTLYVSSHFIGIGLLIPLSSIKSVNSPIIVISPIPIGVSSYTQTDTTADVPS